MILLIRISVKKVIFAEWIQSKCYILSGYITIKHFNIIVEWFYENQGFKLYLDLSSRLSSVFISKRGNLPTD